MTRFRISTPASLLRWPLWGRITLVVILAAMIPTIAGLLVLDMQANATDHDNLHRYVTDRGNDRATQIVNNLNQARMIMAGFVESGITHEALQQVLVSGYVASEDAYNLTAYMEDLMIGAGMFSEIQVLAKSGRVRLSQHYAGETLPMGTNLSNTLAFRTAETLVMLQDDQRLLLSADSNEIALVLVHVVYDATGAPLGYVTSKIDPRTALLPELSQESILLGVRSYLAVRSGQVIALPEEIDTALASARNSPVAEAVERRSGTAEYTVGNEKFVGHYRAVPGLPLALITEAPASSTFVQPIRDVLNQGAIVVFVVVLAAAVAAAFISWSIIFPIQDLQQTVRLFGDGDFLSDVPGTHRHDELGTLSRTFLQAREQTHHLLEAMEERVAARVRDVQATQEVSRFATTQRDVQSLMNSLVDLIVDVFSNIYHAQIFLLDQDEEYAVLRASTGKVGQTLLARGHRLAVGSVSVIGQVTEENRTVVTRDTTESETHHRNEFLPETRAELAIPLRIGKRLIGALDVQSKMSDSFTEDQVVVLQTMADQIAIAIENARLYQESLRQLETLRGAQREATGSAWREYMNFRRQQALIGHAGATSRAGTVAKTGMLSVRQQAIMQERPVIGEETDRHTIPFAVPIQLRGQTLGAVEWEVPADTFNTDKVQLAQELVNRLAVSLDNARLFQESNRAVNRERIVNEIAATLTAQTDIDEILQTAVQEVGRALGAPQVSINLRTSNHSQPPEPD